MKFCFFCNFHGCIVFSWQNRHFHKNKTFNWRSGYPPIRYSVYKHKKNVILTSYSSLHANFFLIYGYFSFFMNVTISSQSGPQTKRDLTTSLFNVDNAILVNSIVVPAMWCSAAADRARRLPCSPAEY